MSNNTKAKPQCNTIVIGCVSDLRKYLSQLPDDVDGLEEMYEINQYNDLDTGEKWLEIRPTK